MIRRMVVALFALSAVAAIACAELPPAAKAVASPTPTATSPPMPRPPPFIAAFEAALRLKPGYSRARNNLKWAKRRLEEKKN